PASAQAWTWRSWATPFPEGRDDGHDSTRDSASCHVRGNVSVTPAPMHYAAAEPVAVDLLNGRLRRGAEIVALRPRDAAVLRQLLDRAGQLVTKDALIAA